MVWWPRRFNCGMVVCVYCGVGKFGEVQSRLRPGPTDPSVSLIAGIQALPPNYRAGAPFSVRVCTQSAS